MTTSQSPTNTSTSISNRASPSSLPRWRSLLSTLNWRRDPDLENEIAQLKRENAKLKQINAKERVLLDSLAQLCSLDESNLTPQTPTEPD